jgi:hypothetical protein
VLEKETNDVIYKTKVRMIFGKKMEHFVQQTVASILVSKECLECPAYKKCRHYMRTLLSQKSVLKDKTSDKTRTELLQIALESAATIKKLQTKNKRLETEMEEMIEVGPKSYSDLQRIFNNLYVGLGNNKEKKVTHFVCGSTVDRLYSKMSSNCSPLQESH